MEEIIKHLEGLIYDRKSFLIKDKEHDEIFLKDIEVLEFAIREIAKADECYQYCRKQEEKINNLYHENEGLKYNLSIAEKRMDLEEEEEELIKYIRHLKEIVAEPEKLFVAIYHKESFKVFDYVPKSKIKEKIEQLNKNELLCKMNFENIKFTIDVLQELLEKEVSNDTDS